MKIINLSMKISTLNRLWAILIVSFLFIAVLPVTVKSQNITNYTFAATSGTFTALTSPTYPPGSGGTVDDGYANNIPIGFDFWYMGILYTTVSASTNGWFTLGADITNASLANNLSGGGTPRPVIAPLWDDLNIQLVTNVSYKTTGTAPNRVFTIQYLNTQWQHNATGNTISFQVKLYESTGIIEFIYRPEAGALSTPSASIGITGTATGSQNFLSVNDAGTSASSTTEANITTKPISGKTYAFTSAIPTAPTTLTFTGITSTSMTLNWADASSNEQGFVIYKSTDGGATYTFVNQTAANATSSSQSGLTADITYYWKVYAVTEGALSTALSGNETIFSAKIFTGTGTNSVTQYIAPMQGYYVQAANAGTLGMDNTVRVHTVAGNWFKNSVSNTSMVSMIVQSDADKSSDEVQLQFGYQENEQGSEKLFSRVVTAPSLYMTSDAEKYSVRYLTDTVDNPKMPVMFKSGQDGTYTLNCNFGFDKYNSVFLEDRQMKYLQNLKDKNTYKFLSSASDDANRFVLHFGPENNSSGNELPARIYSDGNQLIIDLTLVSKETNFMVYDILGRKMLQQKLQGETQHNLSLNASKQILIVYLKNTDGSLSRKLVWAGN